MTSEVKEERLAPRLFSNQLEGANLYFELEGLLDKIFPSWEDWNVAYVDGSIDVYGTNLIKELGSSKKILEVFRGHGFNILHIHEKSCKKIYTPDKPCCRTHYYNLL